jgi:hypothetical protein
MNWYKIAQTLQDIGRKYYSDSYPTSIRNSAEKFSLPKIKYEYLKENGAIVLKLKEIYGEDIDEIAQAMENVYNVFFAKDIVENTTVYLVDIDGPKFETIRGKMGQWIGNFKGSFIKLPAKYDENEQKYITVGLNVVLHEMVHNFDFLTEKKYSFQDLLQRKLIDFVQKIMRKTGYNRWLKSFVDYLYLNLESEQFAQEKSLEAFFTALANSGIDIPEPTEFIDFLGDILDFGFSGRLTPIYFAYKKLYNDRKNKQKLESGEENELV